MKIRPEKASVSLLLFITILHELNLVKFVSTYPYKDLILKHSFGKKKLTEESPNSVSGHLEEQPWNVKYTSKCVFSDQSRLQ